MQEPPFPLPFSLSCNIRYFHQLIFILLRTWTVSVYSLLPCSISHFDYALYYFHFSFLHCLWIVFTQFVNTAGKNPLTCSTHFTLHFHLQNAFKVFFLLAFNAPISWQFLKETTIRRIIEYMKNMREKGLFCIFSLILIPCNFFRSSKNIYKLHTIGQSTQKTFKSVQVSVRMQ